ncbi:MAG: HAD-IG family 5'-nucleotidase [Myxococcota bacterium]
MADVAPELTINLPPTGRGIFCNRTLNMRSINAIGYDMDYTLIHYRVEEWERRAYAHIKLRLLTAGWPVADLEFEPHLVMRGLIIDVELGNVLKANRFGYVKRAFHGTQPLEFDQQRNIYSRKMVDLAEGRFVFLNTLFSLSEGCIYMQLVDLLDQRKLPGVMGYRDLYSRVRQTTDEAHMEGQLKAEIIAEPERFVELDGDTALALLDQRTAGKKLMLITNSEWEYTRAMMAYAFDRFLPRGMTWESLFHFIIVSARKPAFFSERGPVFEVIRESGLLRPLVGPMKPGGVYLGGNAGLVEHHLGVSGDDILYVGDHMHTDVHVSKNVLRWRTALVLRELEAELASEDAFKEDQARLDILMARKERLEYVLSQLRLDLLRHKDGYGPRSPLPVEELEARKTALTEQLMELDKTIAPLAMASSQLHNKRWGMLMRTGNDKSHLARQVERYADIYMSRVSNFVFQSPFVYLRSTRGSLPHDRTVEVVSAEEALRKELSTLPRARS